MEKVSDGKKTKNNNKKIKKSSPTEDVHRQIATVCIGNKTGVMKQDFNFRFLFSGRCRCTWVFVSANVPLWKQNAIFYLISLLSFFFCLCFFFFFNSLFLVRYVCVPVCAMYMFSGRYLSSYTYIFIHLEKKS